MIAANTFSVSRLYDHESVTYQEVFGEFFNVRSSVSANRVILAVSGELPPKVSLSSAARTVGPRLNPYDIRINEYLPGINTEPDWDESARVLTDQYAPANLLNN